MRRFALLLLLMLAAPAAAQDTAPQLIVDFPETETLPGQPLTLRLTVLVPTFMPKPPIWPSYEAPNLLVRLPGRATNPTSQRVGSDTWSGITRRYDIAPMLPGAFSLPPQEITVTYRDPDSGEDTQATLTTEALTFTGTVPEGAEGLDPFIAASDLTLTQELEGTPDAMAAGDSVVRRIVAKVTGVSPMFLPTLMPQADLPGLAAYPDEPRLSESEDRGVTSGTRTESVTYVAEGGGDGTAPGVSLDWYDIEERAVKTATVEEVVFHVDGPPVASGEPRDWRMIALVSAASLLVLLVLAVGLRRMIPIWRERRARHRARVLASEGHAWSALASAVSQRDEAALRPALDLWAERCHGRDPRRAPAVQAALIGIGAARYGGGAAGPDPWQALDTALRAERKLVTGQTLRPVLPPLNPAGLRG